MDVRAEPVPDGWERRWHEYLRPVRVGDAGACGRRGSTARPDDLVIDPGVFFGAGTHATTRLCLELLLDAPPGGALCDWGAGTGVLAIAAARLGWEPVTAVEVEPGALEVDPRQRRAQRRRGRRRGGRPGRDAGAVGARRSLANLPRPLLLAGRLGRLERPPGAAASPPACSRAEADEVAAAFAPLRERAAARGATAGRRWCSR